MKNLLTALIIFSSILTAQDNWSPPLQLSRDGVYPEGYMYPAISVDCDGVIYTFWTHVYPEDGGSFPSYSQIEYRKSSDGSKTWSSTENLTPEYTQHRIMYMKAVCDSKKNVHLVYMRGSEGYEILYKKFDGTTWSSPELIGYGSSYLRMNIDSEDRIYATWMIGREAYFAYCDSDIWSDYKQIGSGEYGIDDFKFGDDNILYSAGTCWTDVKPYLFIYDKAVENWVKIEQIPCNPDSSAGGNAIAVTSDGQLFINYSQGYYTSKTDDMHLSYNVTINDYSESYKYGSNNNPEKEMYIDKYNYLHLFEKHYVEGDLSGPKSLTHSIGKNHIWETTVIESSETNGYTIPYSAFDRVNNKFYLLYMRGDTVNHITRIIFRSKQNTTGIEDNDNHTVEDYMLKQNYPNPFNNQTNISYSIAQNCEVELSVFNPKGQIVAVLVKSKQEKGDYSVSFNTDNLNSGVYYYQLKANGILRSVKRMVYLK